MRRVRKDVYIGHDDTGVCRSGDHRIRAAGVAFNAVGGAIAGAVVEEGVEVRGVKVEADASAKDSARHHLIGEADARAEIGVVRIVKVGDLVALVADAWGWGIGQLRPKDGEVLPLVVQRTFVIPAKPVVDVQLRADLEGILSEKAESVYEDLAVGIPECR